MLVALETSMVYPRPDRDDGDWDPQHLAFEDVSFESVDGTPLHGWYFPQPQRQAAILFFHGNGEDVSDLGDEMNELRKRYNAAVFAFDYRGYGHSEGKPSERGVLADGVAAQRWLSEREGIRADEIVLYGRSLGGGVAVANAASEGAAALVLDRTFHSMVEIAAKMFRWAPVRWLMRNRYPSFERITDYHGPLLQSHGEPDEVVPYWSGQALFEASPSESKRFLSFKRLTHNEPAPAGFYRAFDQLMESLKPLP